LVEASQSEIRKKEGRMAEQKTESGRKPEAYGRPRSWEATLWGRHIRCHELDQHLYLDGRFLDLTPIEFGLFWLLLEQALQVNTGVGHVGPHLEVSWDERRSTMPDRYLERLGIVPTLTLVQAINADLRSVLSHLTTAASGSSARHDTGQPEELEHFPTDSGSPGLVRHSSGRQTSRSRASLSSHLDRLRSKLRCHGLDIGTVLLNGRAARGYLLCPLGDGIVPGGTVR
jgi:hypothetical protein